MGNKEDLTGKRFGNLLVLEEAPIQNHKRMWLCRCDCGKETIVSACHLKGGHTKSCGHLRNAPAKSLIPMEGRRYGHWTVLKRAPNDKNGHRMWECRCDCGNIKEVNGESLRRGISESCGHCGKTIYEYIDEDRMRGILPSGETFMFDAEDYPKISSFTWHMNDSGYLVTYMDNKNQRMHRILVDVPEGYQVDHKDGDTTNNCKENLRICLAKENRRNSRLNSNNSTGYKGVSYNKKRKVYEAYICVNKKIKHLGYYKSAIEAAKAYDKAAVFYFGEYARTNFGDPETSIYGKGGYYEKEILEFYNAQDKGSVRRGA